MPLDERRRLYVATPQSWKEYESCHALTVPSSSVFAYKANVMVDEDELGTAGRQRDVFLRVTMPDHVVMAVMQFIKRAWLWSRRRLEDMLACDPWMVESGHGALFPLSPEVIDRVRQVGSAKS